MLFLALTLELTLCFHLTFAVSREALHALNKTVNGRLIRSFPYARPCFELAGDEDGEHNPQECMKTIIPNYLEQLSLTNEPSVYLISQWETCQRSGEGCLLNTVTPNDSLAFAPPRVCYQGNLPAYAVDVREPADVLSAFNFSRDHNIPLTVKSTGHDYLGRSSGSDSLALWTHNMKLIEYEENFTPNGCPAGGNTVPGLTIGSGTQVDQIIDYAEDHDLTIPTGGDISIAFAGGFTQGGGHGILTNAYGLSSDRALQFEVVTPSGQHLLVNRCQHPDLYFALRGGGGGTFGVVLSMTTLALPKTAINAVFATYNATPQNMAIFVSFMTDHAQSFAEDGWGSYVIPALGVVFANPVLSFSEAQKSIEPLKELFEKRFGSEFNLERVPSYKPFFQKYIVDVLKVRDHTTVIPASRLVTRDNFSSKKSRQELASVIIDIAKQSSVLLFGTMPIFYKPEDETSVTPKLHQTLWHVVLVERPNYAASPDVISNTHKKLAAAITPLRNITPVSGAYSNEADLFEPNFSKSFWGENYERLTRIKKKYDPLHLLDCWHCVGWKGVDDERYKCYIKDKPSSNFSTREDEL